MNSSSISYQSHNLILSDIAKKSGDPSFKWDSEGYYLSLMQEALQELSFDTFFLEVEKIFELKDGCLKFKLPSGFFNIRNIYGFNGPDCSPANGRPIYWKRNYKDKLARDNWGNQGEPYFKHRGNDTPPGYLYFCGISNGEISLSESCKSFQKIMVTANGLITDVGETPVIPMFFRQAVTDYCVVEALSTRIANNVNLTKEVAFWQAIMNRYEVRMNKPYDGSWDKARHRMKIMDKKTRDDIKIYLGRLDY